MRLNVNEVTVVDCWLWAPAQRKRATMLYFANVFLFITRHSLVERMARYLFYCMFVCSSTISRQPATTPKFACGRTLVPDVSSPLLGVGGPRRAEKGANEIFVAIGVNGEFLHFGGF